MRDVASYDACEATTREGGDVEDSLVDDIWIHRRATTLDARDVLDTRDGRFGRVVRESSRPCDRTITADARGWGRGGDRRAVSRGDRFGGASWRPCETSFATSYTPRTCWREMRSRLGSRGANAVEEATRERRSMDLMLVLNARARLRGDARRRGGGERRRRRRDGGVVERRGELTAETRRRGARGARE